MPNFEIIKNIAYLEPECSFSEIAKDEFCKKMEEELWKYTALK